MPSGLSDSLGTSFGPLASYALAAVIVLVLILVVMFIAKRALGGGAMGPAMRKGPRLAVLDIAAIDQRRKLVLVRRDEVEHLMLIGGQNDLLVEGNILRTPAALRHPTQDRGAAARIEPEAIAPGPAPAPRASSIVPPPRPRAADGQASRSASPLRRTVPRVEPREAPVERTEPRAEEEAPAFDRTPVAPVPFAAEIVSKPVPAAEMAEPVISLSPSTPRAEPSLKTERRPEPEDADFAASRIEPEMPPVRSVQVARDSDPEPIFEPTIIEAKPVPAPKSVEPESEPDDPQAARIPSFLRRTDFVRAPEVPPAPAVQPPAAVDVPEPLPSVISRSQDEEPIERRDPFVFEPEPGPKRDEDYPRIMVESSDRDVPASPFEPKLEAFEAPVLGPSVPVPPNPPIHPNPPAPPSPPVPAIEREAPVEVPKREPSFVAPPIAPVPPVAPPPVAPTTVRPSFATRTLPAPVDERAEDVRQPAEPEEPRPLSVRSFATVIQSRRQNFEAVRPGDTWTGRAAQSLATPTAPTAPVPPPAAPPAKASEPVDDASMLDDALTRELDSGLGALDWNSAPSPKASTPPPVVPPVEVQPAAPAPRVVEQPAPPAPPAPQIPPIQPVTPPKPERALTLEEEMERLLGDFDLNNRRR